MSGLLANESIQLNAEFVERYNSQNAELNRQKGDSVKSGCKDCARTREQLDTLSNDLKQARADLDRTEQERDAFKQTAVTCDESNGEIERTDDQIRDLEQQIRDLKQRLREEQELQNNPDSPDATAPTESGSALQQENFELTNDCQRLQNRIDELEQQAASSPADSAPARNGEKFNRSRILEQIHRTTLKQLKKIVKKMTDDERLHREELDCLTDEQLKKLDSIQQNAVRQIQLFHTEVHRSHRAARKR